MKRFLKTRYVMLGIFLWIMLFMFFSVKYFYDNEYAKKPILQEKVARHDADYLYSFYLAGEPNIANRVAYGDADAPLTIVAYLDVGSQATRFFLQEIFPILESEYISSGRVRYYQKYHALVDEYVPGSEDYTIARTLACVGRLHPERYYDAVFGVALADEGFSMDVVLSGLDIDAQEVLSCTENEEFPEIIEDISEVEQFGMNGINQRFYIGIDGSSNVVVNGVPGYTIFNQTLRRHGIVLGMT